VLCAIAWGAACKDEFPNAPPAALSIDAARWHDTVAVSDVDTIQIRVTLVGGGDVTGVQVHWESTDPARLAVTPLEPLVGQEQDSLMLQLQTVITAYARDSAVFVRAIVDRPGFERMVFARQITVMERWVAVSAGYTHSCGVTIEGDAFCWGSGLIGNGSTAGSVIPVPVLGQLTFNSIAAGDAHTCGTVIDGRAYCWGTNLLGQIGNGLPDDQLTPVPVSLGRTFQTPAAGTLITPPSINAAKGYVCGVTTDSTGFCWGDNISWQLGDAGLVGPRPIPSFDNCGLINPHICSRRPRPIQGRNLDTLVLLSIGPGAQHTCAVLASRDALCWGNGSLPLGTDTALITDTTSPRPTVAIRGGLKFASITAGLAHTCGITYPQRQAYCWGFNTRGQLGRPGTDSSTPVQVSSPPSGYVVIDAGEQSTCGIATDSMAYCWGSNEFAQLGTTQVIATCGGVSCSAIPVKLQLPGNPRIISVSVGRRHGCAVTLQGAAYCWGEAADGKLGTASLAGVAGSVNPVRVSEPR